MICFPIFGKSSELATCSFPVVPKMCIYFASIPRPPDPASVWSCATNFLGIRKVNRKPWRESCFPDPKFSLGITLNSGSSQNNLRVTLSSIVLSLKTPFCPYDNVPMVHSQWSEEVRVKRCLPKTDIIKSFYIDCSYLPLFFLLFSPFCLLYTFSILNLFSPDSVPILSLLHPNIYLKKTRLYLGSVWSACLFRLSEFLIQDQNRGPSPDRSSIKQWSLRTSLTRRNG